MKVLIIGAGMAGISAARVLVGAGHEVVIVDKGRAVGGRMASKRLRGARFDHGAQHFSARTAEFRDLVGRLRTEGVVDTWFEARSVTEPDRGVEPRLRGDPAMRSIPEHLARDLDIRLEHRVDHVSIDDGVRVDGVPPADQCIVTAPIPQTLELIGDLVEDRDRRTLESIRYDPCLAAMLIVEDDPGFEDGHLALEEGPVAWMADNRHKGVSDLPAVTVHSSPTYATGHLEETPDEWLPELLAVAGAHVAAPVREAHGHRWRYSLPVNPLDVGALRVHRRIVVAGEAMAGAKVEGAFVSGMAAAAAVLEG